ncbi:enoyl-CoA hydratase/isomerase family protein [SAR86 cluster bacterium]|nr:enoyl-CoA hydratase/isomerase family protein [SAR86 cluster bacterium]
MINYKFIKIEKKKETFKILLNRPRSLNALSTKTLKEITSICNEIALDNKINFVVFGTTSANFSAGADLKEKNTNISLSNAWHENAGRRCIDSILNLPQITFCQIEGFCLGGGAVIASACDFRLGQENSIIGYPEVELGMNLSWFGLPLAISAMGLANAKSMIMSGEKLNCKETLNNGFLNASFEAHQKEQCLKKWLNKFKGLPELQLKMIKKSANEIALSGAKGVMHMEFDQFLLSKK